jgi:hypothetical protein
LGNDAPGALVASGVFVSITQTNKEKEMKIDLEITLKALGLPAGLVALFAAVLGLFGMSLDNILKIVEGLVGTFMLISLVINILKWGGVVTDGVAGYVSAIANLIVLVLVAVVFKLYPQFDFNSVDVQIAEFAKIAGLVFAYIIQFVGSKQVHIALTRGLKLPEFSYSL